jgi:hypothetical protein
VPLLTRSTAAKCYALDNEPCSEGHMQRREFISLLGGAATAWPLAARAQPADKVPTIGFMGNTASRYTSFSAAFAGRLQELRWIEGRTVTIEYRWSEGRLDRVAEIAAEFVRLKVDLIVAYGSAGATLKQATASIPIVLAPALDPVGLGLVASLSHPGGNVTARLLRSPIGPSRQFAATQHFGRVRSKADIDRAALTKAGTRPRFVYHRIASVRTGATPHPW